ncbi:AfsR/SARP family transcriptional regulator [Streptomyces ipomoeae]|uniref:AfsR/SARP family transcriptional regulator n=1 Tax=Streptomyces ipomoeae TaxID=103232 RepID=UPI0011476D5E|nr:BTAD domain-containing putative transcriptional regulator [Streptomyces ipomoeae]MDX2933617.1 BTAD domain-containing putative transcriptional regulator [Streptomyces ipomoeae]TQE22309.1 AfsR/SARP family transcriptional regulator [Streptomyces ipomoeae]
MDDGDARLRVTLLGAFQASRGDAALPVPGARLQGLIVRLALAGGRAVAQGVLVDAIWAEDPPAGPAHALQALVSRLRRTLGSADHVAQVAGGYRLDVDAADVDALRFEQLAAAGRDRLRAGDPHAAAAVLGEAVALWDDRPGAEPTAVAAVAPAAATRLAHASVEAVADLADAELSLGRADTAAARLTALLAEHPVHERAATLLMDALAAQGRRAEALALYERVRRTLADDLGTNPGAALHERHLRLLRAERPTPAADAAQTRPSNLPAPLTSFIGRDDDLARIDTLLATGRPSDPGEVQDRPRAARHAPPPSNGLHTARAGGPPSPHRPKAQVAPPPPSASRERGEDPHGGSSTGTPSAGTGSDTGLPHSRLRTGRGTPTRGGRGNAPALPRTRLVTVVGPGGAGKTRLAVEAARRHRHEYRDGAWMIDLASVTEPAKVGSALLAGIGLRGGAMFEARTRAEGDELDVLVDRLGGRESLLLVDNCEHLIDAVAHLVAALLSRCPGLCVLATSREPLAVDGEALVPLGPLALPGPDDDVEQARRAASVRLFTERAAAVRPGFDVDAATLSDVRRVVRGLDGMPLALELAAARLRTLSLPELADGLSDRFRLLTTGSRTALPRHRTLRAVIAWSWDLLSEHERTVADRVSVLPGGVTAASATAVCAGTAVPAAEIPELLAGLVDRSLLQLAPDPGRYRMLETLREYGTHRLAGTGDLGTVRDLAAGHFAELMARYDPRLRGPGQLEAIRVISAEYDNTLAALRRRCDTGDAPGAVALALNLTWYWQMFGRHTDAVHWLGEALAVPGGEPTPDRDCAHAIHLLNRVGTPSGTSAEEAADDQAAIRELADRLLAYPALPGPYAALTALPLAFLQEEKSTPAIIERLADGDDVWLSGLARMFRAQFAENAGELERTRTDVEAALACFRQVGDRWGQANVLPMRAQLRQYDDDLDGALADLREARSLAGEFGSLGLGDEVLGDLRWIDLHLRCGDTDLVIAMIDSARERALRANSPEWLFLVDAWDAVFRVRLGDLDRARELLGTAERGLHGDTPFPGDHARTLVGSARASLCLATGDPAGAEKALAKAYAAALETRDLPILALVAVNVAALAEAHGRHHESAVLLGAASRLRGAHDRTDRQVRDLTRRGRAALGEEAFAAAYGKGWELDRRTAVTEVDPARLSRELRTAHPDPE